MKLATQITILSVLTWTLWNLQIKVEKLEIDLRYLHSIRSNDIGNMNEKIENAVHEAFGLIQALQGEFTQPNAYKDVPFINVGARIHTIQEAARILSKN